MPALPWRRKGGILDCRIHPSPPRLTDQSELQWSDAELYWIIKNGVKDTGMAAFGATHDDEELWALAGLTRQLPGMTVSQFKGLRYESK